MKKYLWLLPLWLVFNTVNSAEIVVQDITKNTKIIFTPGDNFFLGVCSYNWGGDKKYKVVEFFEGATSYSLSTYNSVNKTLCSNIKTDIADQVIIPYIHQSRFTNRISTGSVEFSPSEMLGTFFTVKESSFDFNETYIYAGTIGTSNYFYCQLPTDSLTLQWVLSTGIEKSFAPGWKFKMTWFGSSKRCAGIKMEFDYELLIPNIDPIPPKCSPGCIPAL